MELAHAARAVITTTVVESTSTRTPKHRAEHHELPTQRAGSGPTTGAAPASERPTPPAALTGEQAPPLGFPGAARPRRPGSHRRVNRRVAGARGVGHQPWRPGDRQRARRAGTRSRRPQLRRRGSARRTKRAGRDPPTDDHVRRPRRFDGPIDRSRTRDLSPARRPVPRPSVADRPALRRPHRVDQRRWPADRLRLSRSRTKTMCVGRCRPVWRSPATWPGSAIRPSAASASKSTCGWAYTAGWCTSTPPRTTCSGWPPIWPRAYRD